MTFVGLLALAPLAAVPLIRLLPREQSRWAALLLSSVIFIGSLESGHECTWSEFKMLSNVEYDPGYGAQEVASDLVIVFSDHSRLYRREDGGAESWEFTRAFVAPEKFLPITKLVGGAWSSVAETCDAVNEDEAR